MQRTDWESRNSPPPVVVFNYNTYSDSARTIGGQSDWIERTGTYRVAVQPTGPGGSIGCLDIPVIVRSSDVGYFTRSSNQLTVAAGGVAHTVYVAPFNAQAFPVPAQGLAASVSTASVATASFTASGWNYNPVSVTGLQIGTTRLKLQLRGTTDSVVQINVCGLANVATTLEAGTYSATVGQSLQISTYMSNCAGDPITAPIPSFSSLDPALVSVTSSGLATVLGPGVGRVVVQQGQARDTATITANLGLPVVTSWTIVNKHPKLVWSAVAGATEYHIYRQVYGFGALEHWATVTGTQYVEIETQVSSVFGRQRPTAPTPWVGYYVHAATNGLESSGAPYWHYFAPDGPVPY